MVFGVDIYPVIPHQADIIIQELYNLYHIVFVCYECSN